MNCVFNPFILDCMHKTTADIDVALKLQIRKRSDFCLPSRFLLLYGSHLIKFGLVVQINVFTRYEFVFTNACE